MQKIRIRQDIDNRIGGRVEEPVVIVESELMKRGKSPVPVQGDGCSDNGWQGHSQDSRQLQISIALLTALPENPGGTCQRTEDSYVFKKIEDVLYFFIIPTLEK